MKTKSIVMTYNPNQHIRDIVYTAYISTRPHANWTPTKKTKTTQIGQNSKTKKMVLKLEEQKVGNNMNETYLQISELLGADPVMTWIVDCIDELDDTLEDKNSSYETKSDAQMIKLYLENKRAERQLYLKNKGER